MNSDEVPGFLALKHANGMSWKDVLDLHAHMLAEQIRHRPFVAHYGHGTFIEGSETAADLIDPKVDNGQAQET